MDSLLTTHAHLHSLAALAERRYSSLPETIAATLQAVAAQMSVRSSVLLMLDRQQQALEINAVYHADAASPLSPGMRWPFTASDAAILFAPLALADITAAPVAAPFLAHPIFANIRCYISVPMRCADGTVSGFLCGVAGAARQFTAEQIAVMTILARHLAAEIEHEREITARRAAESQAAHALAALRAAQGEVERARKIKSDFVTIVSHEFRTALTGIQGFSEIVRDEECSRDEVKEYAADINADARRLNRLITDMLDLDRLEAGSMKLAAGRVNLHALLGDIVTRFRATAPQHTIHLQCDPNLPALPGDDSKLDQAFSHLLSNAIKFSPGGGTVAVSARRDGDFARVSVADKGMGIPAAELERVFERYARVEVGASRYIQGAGLGLSIVRDLVQLHGGEAWAESVLGQSATFHVTLPLTATR